MKTFAVNTVVLVLLSPFAFSVAKADIDVCPAYIQTNPELSKSIEFLRSISGSYNLGRCKIEIHVCRPPSSSDDAAGSVVGDFMLVDQKGRESYAEFVFPRIPVDEYVRLENGSVMFHYEFDDFAADPVFGRRQSVRLEFVKSRDKQTLIRVESGWYSTNDWSKRRSLRHPGSVYNWSVCKGTQALAPKDFLSAASIIGEINEGY